MDAYTEFQNLGDLLKYLIQKKGWSQGRLAIAMDSSPGYVSKLIRNTIKEPRRSTLNKIYDIFKTDLASFALNSEDLIKINDYGNQERCKVSADNMPESFSEDVKVAASPQNLIRNISLDNLNAYVGRSPLVFITGTKGIGKSTLAQSFYQTNYQNFQKSIFLPITSCGSIDNIAESIGAYLGHENSGNPMRDIIAIAKQHKCLIMLDNLDLDHQEYCSFYNLFLQQLMMEPHLSFIIVTCRSLPKGSQSWEPRIKALRLEGLAVSEASKLLENQGISLKIDQLLIKELIQKYGGNPLGLKLAAQDINEKFKGDLGAYLKHSALFAGDLFDDIHSILQRLSPLELEVLYWLALRKEPIYFMDILTEFPDQYKTSTVAIHIDAAINELCRRSLLASCDSEFYLQTEVQHCVEYCLLDDLTLELNEILALTCIDELSVPLRWLRCLDLRHPTSKLRDRLMLYHANLLEQTYTKLESLSSRVTNQQLGYAFTNLKYFLGIGVSA
jgi:transcriptional regulator with XRE-family HTH domain